MEGQLLGLGVEMYKVALIVSAPILFVSMIVGLLVSIFQATTQINEMTLSFIPKIVAVIAVAILAMPWMLNLMIDYTKDMFELIPTFIF